MTLYFFKLEIRARVEHNSGKTYVFGFFKVIKENLQEDCWKNLFCQ